MAIRSNIACTNLLQNVGIEMFFPLVKYAYQQIDHNLLPAYITKSGSWVMVCVKLGGNVIVITPSKSHFLFIFIMINPATDHIMS
jgi:hypothetical protein